MVHEAMSECLTHLYTRGSITMATLCNGSLLTDIILGTKASAAKKGTRSCLCVCFFVFVVSCAVPLSVIVRFCRACICKVNFT